MNKLDETRVIAIGLVSYKLGIIVTENNDDEVNANARFISEIKRAVSEHIIESNLNDFFKYNKNDGTIDNARIDKLATYLAYDLYYGSYDLPYEFDFKIDADDQQINSYDVIKMLESLFLADVKDVHFNRIFNIKDNSDLIHCTIHWDVKSQKTLSGFLLDSIDETEEDESDDPFICVPISEVKENK